MTLELGTERFSRSAWDHVSLRYQNQDPGRFRATFSSDLPEPPHSALFRQPDLQRLADDYVKPALECLLFGTLQNVVALPAERKALVTIYNLLSEKSRDLLSLPVVSFSVLLADAETVTRHGSGKCRLPEARDLLEDRILAGKLAFAGEHTPLSLTYAGSQGPPLKMHAASSLVRALAGLDVYLQYMAQPEDLIVIDEPEMNAHPEAQLMIAELLAVLVNKGVHVVITTHSPYIVDHLNNLVEAGHVPQSQQAKLAARFTLGTTDAFLSSEMVAAYFFDESGNVVDIFDRDEHDIDWSTFGSTSDRMSHLFNEILQATRRE